MLLNKVKPYAKDILGDYVGFMQGKSTVNQIYSIKQNVDKIYEFNQYIYTHIYIYRYLLLVDFKQAYDSIKISMIW